MKRGREGGKVDTKKLLETNKKIFEVLQFGMLIVSLGNMIKFKKLVD
jgi:hypothetical protein